MKRGAYCAVLITLLLFLPATRLSAQSAAEVYKKVAPGVVLLKNPDGSGTGMVLDKTGLILTNAHVVSSPLPFVCSVEMRIGDKSELKDFKRVKIIAFHPKFDMALVRIDPKEHAGVLSPVRLSPKKAEQGIDVIAIGNPGGGGADVELTRSITRGILSGLDREVDGIKYYQTDAAINPGNSGGPLCNMEGEIIGINTLKLNNVDNVGFSLPLFDLKTEEFVSLAQRKGDKKELEEMLRQVEAITEKLDELRKESDDEDDPRVRYVTMIAMRILSEAISEDPLNPVLYFKAGQMLRQLKFERAYKASTSYFLQSIALNPWGDDSAQYFRELGLSYKNLNQWQEAHAAWNEGVKKFPTQAPFLWDALANYWYSKEGNYLEASKAAHLAITAKGELSAERQAAMRKLIDASKKKFSPADTTQFNDFVGKAGEQLQKMQTESDAARKAAKLYLSPEFSKLAVVSSFADPNEKQDLTIRDDARFNKTPVASNTTTRPITGSSTSPSPAMPAFKPIPGSEDVLAGIRVSDDTVKGTWKQEGDVLINAGTAPTLLKLPVHVPEQYDLSLVLERKSGTKDFVIGFVRGGQLNVFYLDRDKLSGLNPDDRRSSYKGEVCKPDTPVTVVVRVRNAGLQVLADGNQIFLVRSTDAFDAAPAEWDPGEAGTLCLGTNGARFAIHKIYLTPYPYPTK